MTTETTDTAVTMKSEEPAYYVYLYRDPDSMEIRYVGKGKGVRVVNHLKGARNQAFKRWLEQLERRRIAPVIELMSCSSEAEALAVEAALISAHWQSTEVRSRQLFNRVHGHHAEFVPIGLPQDLRRRRYEAPLTRDDLLAHGALVVYINTRKFQSDAREGATPRLGLETDAIRERIRKWWQIGGPRETWLHNPDSAPQLMLGVTGPVDRRWIFGSMKLTVADIEAAKSDGGLWALNMGTRSVDAAKLRGRLLVPASVGPRELASGARGFGSIRSQHFDVVTNESDRGRAQDKRSKGAA